MKNEKLSTVLLTIIILLIMGVLLFLGYKFFFNVDISNSKDLAPIKTEEIGKEKYQFLYAKHSALNNEFIFFIDGIKFKYMIHLSLNISYVIMLIKYIVVFF